MRVVKSTESAIALLKELRENAQYYANGDMTESAVVAVRTVTEDVAGYRQWLLDRIAKIDEALADLQTPSVGDVVREIQRD
jgi:hypothetical protein